MRESLLIASSKLSSFCQRALLLSLLSLGLTTASYAQVASTYVFSEASGVTYNDFTGGSVVTGSTADFTTLANTSYTLPFTFSYNSTAITDITILDNGFIVLGNTAVPTSGTTNPISNAGGYTGAVACYGMNIAGVALDGCEIRYGFTGSAPNRIVTIQYKNVRRRPLSTTAGLLNMQILLYETSNNIEVVYRDQFTSTAANLVGGQVGLRGSANTDFNNRKNTTNLIWPATDAGTVNTDVLNTQGINPGGGIVQGNLAGTRFRWVPCAAPSGITATLQPDNTTAIINWTAPSQPPSGGYDWEVRTSGNPGSASPCAAGTTALTTATVLNLVPNITYYFYVKSNCSSTWLPTNTHPSSLTITPACTLGSFPYTEDFESAVTPIPSTCTTTTLPNCTTRIINSSNVDFATRNSALVTPNYGFSNKNLITVGNNAADVWFFTKGIPIPAAGSYRLSYKYGGTREQDFFKQKMKVYYGATASVAGMTTMLVDHDDIKDSPLTNVINFTVGAAGTYYIGFNAYGDAAQGYVQLDDIALNVTTCFAPTALVSGQLASSTAVIAWTADPSASTGYQYYVAPAVGAIVTAGAFVPGQTYLIKTLGTTNYTLIGGVNTVGTYFTATGVGAGTGTAQHQIIPPATPSSSVVVTGNVSAGMTIANLSGLTPSTMYDFWVRSNCGGGDYSQWSIGATFTTKPLVVYCTPSAGGNVQDPRGIINVTIGSINNTTGIEADTYGNYSSLTTNVAQGSTPVVSITNGTTFTYDTMIWVDWNNDGDFADAGETVYTGVMPAPNPSTINATFTAAVPVLDSDGNSTLGPHRMRIGGIDAPTFIGGALTPCRVGQYQAFEDYTLYVITAPPALTLSAATDTICEGLSTLTPVTITSTVSDFQVYTWSPAAGVSGSIGAGFTFSPTATTTYTLTGTQTSGNFSSNTATFIVTVNARPTPILVTPASATYCNGAAPLALVATGGVVTGVFNTVFEENFNDPTNTFTTVNNTTGGSNPAAAAWTLWASGVVNSSGQSFTSNDSSQYYLSDSDATGFGGITRTELISPSFSLVGFVDASLSFWHQYDYLDSPAVVEISTNDGATWVPTPLASYNSDQGSPNNFSNAILNLTPYIGMSNLKIRFRYVDADWDWEWAIDNVRVYGSGTSIVTWSPTTDLYTDAAGTIPYTGTAASTVYTKPTTNRTYTANSTSSFGCTRDSSPVVITFSSPTAGTASSNQNICSGIPADLTVAGYAGTVTKWQYSPNATFLPIGTVVDIPSSNSATLTSAQMGVLSTDRYYRAVTTSGGCDVNSSVVAITISKTIWDGGSWSAGEPNSGIAAEFQGDYISSANTPLLDGNLSACSVIVSNGADVLFDIGTLSVQNAVTVVSGYLTVEDDASLYQVVDVANAVGVYSGGNSGLVTSRRTAEPMFRYDYTYWSSPVNPQNLLAVSPGSPQGLFLTFNSTTGFWQYLASPNINMTVGLGYAIRAPQSYNIGPIPGPQAYTASFYGVPNSGTFTVPIVGGASQMNLIGNPYPSALYAPDFINGNPNVSGTLYFWTHNTPLNASYQYAANDYAIFNLVGGTLPAPTVGAGTSDLTPPLGNIASGQGFFVKGLTSGTATFSNSMRRAGSNSQFYRTNNTRRTDDTSLEKHRYWLDVTNTQGAFKQVLIGYVETATSGLDRLFDGEMVDVGNAITLYTMVEDAKLSIEGRPLPFDVNETIPLGYKSTIDGTYTISLSHFDGLFDTQHVYLEDTALNIIHDLRVSPYTFSTVLGTFESRFILRYTNATLGTTNPVFNENTVVVYKNSQGLFIDSGAINMATVSIFDIRGRMLATQKQVNRTTTVFTTLPTTNQVLLVRIQSENGSIVTKKVVY